MGQPAGAEEFRVSGRIAATIGLILGLAPVAALAQVNLDQGKTAAQIFAADCATCHKAPRGLGAGKNSLMLSSFLREHYTSSKEQAASLAAYVLGAGGGGEPAQNHGLKPAAATATERAKIEEPKPATRAGRPNAKPEESPPATAKLQEPKSEEEPSTLRREPPNGARGRRKEPEGTPAVQEPAAVVAQPAAAPAEESSPAAAGAANAEPGEAAPVPRDDIPD
jgi:hypothetical protein